MPAAGSTVLALAEVDAQETVKKQEKQLEKKKKKAKKETVAQAELPGFE